MDYAQSSIINRQSSIRRGFTLVECLVGLAISAVLLAAVAAAFSASLTSYRENEQMFWAVNNARQALTRMTSEIRTASPDPSLVPAWAVDPLEPDTRCSLHTWDDKSLTFEFRSNDRRLYLIDNHVNQEYLLCDNVVDAEFTKILTDNGTDCKSVQIRLTVQVGNNRQTLSASAVVRRNLSL